MPEPILEPGDICTCFGFIDSQVFIGWSVLFWEHLLWCTLTRKIAARGALPNTALTFGTCAKISCKFLHKPSELLLEIRKSIKKKCSRKETLITGESNKALLKRRRVLVPFRILLSELPNYIKFQWWPLQILRHLLVNIADLTNVCNLNKCAKHKTFEYWVP